MKSSDLVLIGTCDQRKRWPALEKGPREAPCWEEARRGRRGLDRLRVVFSWGKDEEQFQGKGEA